MDDAASVTDQLVPQLSIPHSPLSTVTLVAKSESSMSVVQNKMDVPIQTGNFFTNNACVPFLFILYLLYLLILMFFRLIYSAANC